MTWIVVGFDKHDDHLVIEFELPGTFTDRDAAAWVGDDPMLQYASFPMSEDSLNLMATMLSVEVDPQSIAYFLECVRD